MKDVKKIMRMNYRREIMTALTEGTADLGEICQRMVVDGVELEDLKLLPSIFDLVASTLVRQGWAPKVSAP